MKRYLAATFLVAVLMPALPSAAEEETSVIVYKTPWCGCCHEWAEALKAAGYDVTTEDHEDLEPIKRMAGVPADMEGCHTAAVDGYFLEGHVPLEAISKLLEERPEVAGLAVPGMPAGSLGMGDDPQAEYSVFAVSEGDAQTTLFYEAGQS